MIFLFGIKRNLLIRTPLEGCACPNCNNQTLLASKFGSYFHLFFVPFFPVGKSLDLECYHCYKKFDGKYLPADIRDAMQRNPTFYLKKRPLWHSMGCLGVLSLIVLSIGFTLFSILFHFTYKPKPKVRTVYEKLYDSDLKKMTNTPDCDIDSISCYVKTYVDSMVPYNINLDKVKYFSKLKPPYSKNSKVIILLKIEDLDVVEPDRRNMIVSYVIDAMEERNYDKHNLYICLRDNSEPIVVYTPESTQLGGYGADDSSLANFYRKN